MRNNDAQKCMRTLPSAKVMTKLVMSKLVIQPSFRKVGQTHAEWQTFKNFKANEVKKGLSEHSRVCL